MTNPYGVDTTARMSMLDVEAAKHAAGGQDVIEYIRSLERRIERLEAQLNTH